MTTAESLIIVVAVCLIALVIGNVVFQFIAEWRNPPIGRFIECDNVRLHYIDRGNPEAPCVVLFHGNGSLIQDFTASGLVALLAIKYRVICFDRPGFGHNQRPRTRIWMPVQQADLFAKALDQLGVRDPIVFGHSWGTLVAIAVALKSDYPVRGVVLVSGYYFPTARFDFWMMSGPAVPILGDLMRYTVAPIISWAMLPGILRKLFAPRRISERFKKEFPTSLTLRPKQLRAAAEESAFLIPAVSQMQQHYSKLRCPLHIVHGADDQLIEPEQAQRLHQMLGHSVLHLVKEAGHMVTYTSDARIGDTVAAIRNEGEERWNPWQEEAHHIGSPPRQNRPLAV